MNGEYIREKHVNTRRIQGKLARPRCIVAEAGNAWPGDFRAMR
jgi:hypothetical protein